MVRKCIRFFWYQWMRFWTEGKTWLSLLLILSVFWLFYRGNASYLEETCSLLNGLELFIGSSINQTPQTVVVLGFLFMTPRKLLAGEEEWNYLLKIGRKNWFFSKVLFILFSALFYQVILLAGFWGIIRGQVYWDNQWSPTFYLLSQSTGSVIGIAPVFSVC